MNIVRRACAVGNYSKGRKLPQGMEVDQITIHVTEGTAASARSWFNDPRADVSAHYLVNKNGTIDQFVDERDTAQHNGFVDRPTAPLVLLRPGVNPNVWSIGIEHEGRGNEELTPAQRAASTWLISDICRRRPAIKLDRRHIVGHHEVRAGKTCPGKINVDALVAAVTAGWAPLVAQVAPPSARPPAPQVVWSDYLSDWLVVTRVVSETEWYFVPAKAMGTARPPLRASAPLSQMPRAA
jgi:N-acetylmuramoyl-L-alanine amidase CwlA